MDPARRGGRTGGVWTGEEWQVAVGEGTGRRIGRPCEPGFVVVPRYDPGAETALTRLSDTEAFFALAVNAVNLLPHGAAATEALGRLAAGCRCYALTMSDLDEACRLVEGLVAEAGAAAPGGRCAWAADWPDGEARPGAATVPRRCRWTTTSPSTTRWASS